MDSSKNLAFLKVETDCFVPRNDYYCLYLSLSNFTTSSVKSFTS